MGCCIHHSILGLTLALLIYPGPGNPAAWGAPMVMESSFTMARLSGKLEELKDAMDVTWRSAGRQNNQKGGLALSTL